MEANHPIEEVRLEVKYNTDAQPPRRKKYQQNAPPAVNKQFFAEVDEASIMLKHVFNDNMALREKKVALDSPSRQVDLETLNDSKQ